MNVTSYNSVIYIYSIIQHQYSLDQFKKYSKRIMQVLKLSMKIEFLLGNSSKKITQIAHAKQGLLYVCGCYIVFYSPQVDEQVAYIKHRNPNISAISVSPDQNLIAVAQIGKHPSICVYSIQQILSTATTANTTVQQITPLFTLKGHKQSIDLLKFSPNSKYLVSICNSDGSMFIWQNGQAIARNKIAKQVNVIMFDWNQDLLTVGNGHVKVWKFDNGKILRKKEGDYWMIEGKLVSLGKSFSNKNYIDCGVFENKNQPGNYKMILLSSEGFLGTISKGYDKVQKWVDLMMGQTTSLQIYGNLVLCAGENSVIKIIDLVTLSLRGKFPKPPPLKKQNISKDQQLQIQQDEKFPTCLGISIFSNFILTLYQNGTIFIWTMQQDIKAFRSIITHREKINCVSLLQQIHGDICFFATAAQDNTLRIWHFYTKCYESNRQSIDIAEIIGIKRNAYCKNLTRIIYTTAEHPIIQTKLFMRKYLACISRREFIMYSLDTFELVLYQNFQTQYRSISFKNPDIVLSLQTSQDLIYLGFYNGFLKVYKPSQENLLKLRQIDFGDTIQQLHLCGERKILIQCKNKVIIFDFENNSKTIINNIIQSSSTSKYLFLAEEMKLIYFSVIKNRKVAELSLVHQFDVQEKVKKITNNKSFVVILSSKNRLVIANYSATIIYSERLNEQITDIVITESGQLILTGMQGNVVIRIIVDSMYKHIECQAKKWFQQNDMSWMDNSVWASKQINSHSNIRNKLADNSIVKTSQCQSILGDIDRAKSINLDKINNDYPVEITDQHHPSVQYKYKNQQNKISIFNPSTITRQANQIYANVNGLMRNLNVNVNDEKNIRMNFSADLDQDDFFKNSLSSLQKQKNNMFEHNSNSTHYPKFTNNLVESQMTEIKQAVQESNLINAKRSQPRHDDQVHVVGRSKSSSPIYSRIQKNSYQSLNYSTELPDAREGNNNVNTSLKLSQNFIKSSKDQKEKLQQTKIIHTFQQIVQASKRGVENIDQTQIKSLMGQNIEEFYKLYLVLDQIFAKQKPQSSVKAQTRGTIIDKQSIINEYKKMSQAYLQFLENSF